MVISKESLLIELVKMLEKYKIISEMHEQTLLNNIDNFLEYWGFRTCDINIKEIVGQLLEDRPILLENFKVYGEVDFSYSVLNIGRFRVNIFKQKAYWAVAIRMISEKIPLI